MRGKRVRLATATGREFSFVDRGKKGFWIDLKLPERRFRELVCHGGREQAARAAISRVEEISAYAAPSLLAHSVVPCLLERPPINVIISAIGEV